MAALRAGIPFPKTEVSKVGGGTLTIGEPQGGHKWQIVVIFRGWHCPKCKDYLEILQGLQADYHAAGIDVVTATADPIEKAQKMSDEFCPTVPMGYDMSIAQMHSLGLYVSDPRDADETDRPLPEPGVFVINPDGNMQMVDVSNVPFMRPDLAMVLMGIQFHREKGFPVRGMNQAA